MSNEADDAGAMNEQARALSLLINSAIPDETHPAVALGACLFMASALIQYLVEFHGLDKDELADKTAESLREMVKAGFKKTEN